MHTKNSSFYFETEMLVGLKPLRSCLLMIYINQILNNTPRHCNVPVGELNEFFVNEYEKRV